MALAYNIVDRGAFGDLAVRVVDLTLDNTYAAGGWVLDARALGFGLNGVIYGVIPMTHPGFVMDFNPATGRLRARDASGAAGAATPEVANANAAINGAVIRCLVLGKGHG